MGTPEFGKSFEHFILMELIAYQAYKNPELEITYWRTSTGYEVDFILNDMEVAIEVKTAKRIHETDIPFLPEDANSVRHCEREIDVSPAIKLITREAIQCHTTITGLRS